MMLLLPIVENMCLQTKVQSISHEGVLDRKRSSIRGLIQNFGCLWTWSFSINWLIILIKNLGRGIVYQRLPE